MTLRIDRRSDGTPGTHALVVGISRYDHLVGGTNPSERISMGLQQLSSAARSALRFYEWLSTARLAKPLATCRLLLAPSAQEAAEPAMADLGGSVTVEDFFLAATDWIADACRTRDEATIFYFCGQKLRIGSEEDILLFQDFGNQRGPLLRGGVSFSNVFNGMGSRDELSEQTQHYFVDGSRSRATDADIWTRGATDVFDVRLRQQDRRAAGVFHAAASGERALEHVDGITFFAEALLRGLSGAAGTQRSRGRTWMVTTESLARWMGEAGAHYAREHDAQVFFPVSLRGDAVICQLEEAPKVAVSVSVEPEQAAADARLRVTTGTGEVVATMPMAPSPVRLSLPAGIYEVRLEFRPESGWRDVQVLESIVPPSVDIVLDAVR